MENFSLGKLIDLIKEVADQDALAEISISEKDADTDFGALGVDSLTILSVVAQLEKQYGISVSMEEATHAKTVTELFTLVSRHFAPVMEVA